MASDLLVLALLAKTLWDLASGGLLQAEVFLVGAVSLAFLLGLGGRWGHQVLKEGLAIAVLGIFAGMLHWQAQRMSNPSSIRLPWRADQTARFSTRWSFVKWRSVASPITRKAPVTVRVPGVRIAPKSNTCACCQTRSEKSGANAAKTSMISLGRLGIGYPPLIV